MWAIRPTLEQSIEVWRPFRKDAYEQTTAFARAAGSAPLSLELVNADGAVVWTSDGARFGYVTVGPEATSAGLRETYLFSGQVTWGAV